jgi:hypothetical protein
MSTSAEGSHQHRLPISSSQPPRPSLSLVMLPWPHPASITIDHLISSIESVSTARIIGLKWCKDRHGAKHQFLLVEVERPEHTNLWIRLDRRAQADQSVEDWVAAIHSTSPTTVSHQTSTRTRSARPDYRAMYYFVGRVVRRSSSPGLRIRKYGQSRNGIYRPPAFR